MPSYVVTGANRGLGYGFVQYLASDPANTVIGIVRNKAAADKTIAKDGLTKNVHMVEAEIANHASLIAVREQISSLTGGVVDYLIHNAAVVDRTTAETALDELEDNSVLETALLDSFRTNVIGPINTTNVLLPLIKKSSIKKVALISTGAADPAFVNGMGVAGGAPYAISKAAANMAIFKYNAKYQKEGILFFAISPGIVATWSEEEGEWPMIPMVRQMMPQWEGPLTPLQSAEAVLKVVKEFTAEKNGGAFVSHHGDQNWL
jgi:NAD(P)-dependent dehydrogenase (short-subunit alcohol dehydrogenase family)